jgi:hypothetical protein
MADAIRTRCKFRVVGVENTENAIFTKIYEDVDPDAYLKFEGHEYTDYPPNPDKRLGGGREGRKYKSAPSGKYAQNIRLAASYDPSSPEDVSFAAATPSGTMTFYCDNPIVVDTFNPGKNYYLDLIPCDK